MPVFVAVGKLLGVVIVAAVKGFTAFLRIITKVIPVLRNIVKWVKDAVQWVGNLLNKIPKIQIPDINIPGLSSVTNIGTAAASASGAGVSARAGNGFDPGRSGGGVVVNIYGGDPAAVEATVLRALRGYARKNGQPQVLPSW